MKEFINLMNYTESDNNWEELAIRIQPEMTMVDYGFFEENGKTKAILARWGDEGGKTEFTFYIARHGSKGCSH